MKSAPVNVLISCFVGHLVKMTCTDLAKQAVQAIKLSWDKREDPFVDYNSQLKARRLRVRINGWYLPKREVTCVILLLFVLCVLCFRTFFL